MAKKIRAYRRRRGAHFSSYEDLISYGENLSSPQGFEGSISNREKRTGRGSIFSMNQSAVESYSQQITISDFFNTPPVEPTQNAENQINLNGSFVIELYAVD